MSTLTLRGNGVSTDFPVPSALAVSSVSVGGSGVSFTQPLGPHMVRLSPAPALGAVVVIDFAENPVPSEGGGGGGGGPLVITNGAANPVLVQQYDEANPLASGALNVGIAFTRANNTVDPAKTVVLTKAGAQRSLTYNSAGELLGMTAWSLA